MNVHYTHRVSVYWPTQHKKRRHHIVSVAKSFWESLEAKRVSGGMSECIRYCAELWGCERPWAGTFIRHSQSGGCRRWCSTVENYRRYDVSSSNGDNFHIHSDFWGRRKRHLTTIVHKYFLRSFHPFCSYRMTLKGRFSHVKWVLVLAFEMAELAVWYRLVAVRHRKYELRDNWIRT